MDQMYKKLDSESLVDQKLNEWKNSLPANRDQRRYQLKKYKYYLFFLNFITKCFI